MYAKVQDLNVGQEFVVVEDPESIHWKMLLVSDPQGSNVLISKDLIMRLYRRMVATNDKMLTIREE